jgi:hypothetical protein
MKRPSILLLARTGFIIRDIVLGKFSEEITKEFDLIVAVPNPYDSKLLDFIKNKSIRLIQFYQDDKERSQLSEYLGPQHWMYRIKQVERNNSSLEINTRLMRSHYSPRKKILIKIMLFISKIIQKMHLIGLTERLFISSISTWKITKQWESVLKELKPSSIVSTGLTLPMGFFLPSPDLPVLIAAHKLNIPCGTLVQSWDNLSSKTYVLPQWLNCFWTWSEKMSNDLLFYNPRIKQNRVRIVGSPHYDFHCDSSICEERDSYLRRLGLDPKKPYIIIGTGTKSMFPDAPFLVLDLVKSIRCSNEEIGILLRIHPKDEKERWNGVLNELKNLNVVFQNAVPETPMDLGGFISPREYFFELVNTIRHAAVVVNASSSLTVDSAILDTPVITLCYDRELDNRFPEGRAWSYNNSEHFLPLLKTGGVKPVYSNSECIEAIFSYIGNRSLDKEGRKKISDLIGGLTDGNAGIELAYEVKKITETAKF